MKLIVGMTGAPGAPLVALLQALREMPNVETHLVMSKWAKTTIELETPYNARDVAALADFCHNPADQAATISSGSFRTDGMIVIPCSMKTLAGIRAGYADGLLDSHGIPVHHLSVKGHGACIRRQKSGHYPHQRCLSGPIWSQQAQKHPVGNLHGNTLHRFHITELFMQVIT